MGETLHRIEFVPLDAESKLEQTLKRDISILSPDLMVIGCQVPTAFGKFIDILALDQEGKVVVIELKRDRTPREVVAQILDYASWIEGLSYKDIAALFSERNPGKQLEQAFADAFGDNPPDELNQDHELIVVASELDPSTERIINYLSDSYGVPVNAVFFRYFRDGDNEYLARTWLIDPHEAEAKASRAPRQKGRESWNGRDFYVSLGESPHRTWEDCVKYGYISGGGGRWYSQTLDLLFPGARAFVNIPKTGYVGVGTITGRSTPVSEFRVNLNGREIPILEAPLSAKSLAEHATDPEKYEYFVPVDWIKTLPKDQAYWEKGLFAVQHTACRLRSRFTLERLTKHFGLED
jgi:hypothetical protein